MNLRVWVSQREEQNEISKAVPEICNRPADRSRPCISPRFLGSSSGLRQGQKDHPAQRNLARNPDRQKFRRNGFDWIKYVYKVSLERVEKEVSGPKEF